MAKQLETITVTSPGFFGVNTQDPWKVDPNYCLVADNCIIDKMGRVGTRKGWKYRTPELSRKPIISLSRFEDVNGREDIISWDGQGNFYLGTELETLEATQINRGADGTPTLVNGEFEFIPYTIPTGDWKAVTLNDHIYFFQTGEEPLVFTRETGSIEFKKISDHEQKKKNDKNSTPKAVPLAGIALSAYGRVFVADTGVNKNTVHFSSLLDGGEFGGNNLVVTSDPDQVEGALPTPTSDVTIAIPEGQERTEYETNPDGRAEIITAGSINVSALFTKGTDTITGLGAINGYLVIFCHNSIIIFGDTNDANNSVTLNPVNLQLIEIIEGVGCVATKSIQNVGNDIFFLSDSGVKSLGRTIQEKSQPYQDISLNVKTDLISDLGRQDVEFIRSAYSDTDNYYLLSFPALNKVYCFDTRQPLETGALRVTTWSNVTHTDYLTTPLGFILTAQSQGIAAIETFEDNDEDIRMTYLSPFLDLGNPTSLKILKKLSAVLVGASSQNARLTSSFDFSPDVVPYSIQLQGGKLSRYGEARYNSTDTYSAGVVAQAPVVSAAGNGNLIQIGFFADVKEAPTSIQKLDIFLKQGKTL